MQHMGQYPVIFLTLKSAKQPNFEMAYASLTDEIQKEYYSLCSEESRKEFFLQMRDEFNTKALDPIRNTTLFFFFMKTCHIFESHTIFAIVLAGTAFAKIHHFAAAAVFGASPEVAAAYHNSDLHTHVMRIFNTGANGCHGLCIQTGLFLTGKRFTADFENLCGEGKTMKR